MLEQAPAGDLLTYPRDKARVMAKVNHRNITLEDVVQHIDSRHFSGFADYVSTAVGQFEIRSPLMAKWVRQLADVIALETEARKRGISETAIKKEQGAVLIEALRQFEIEYSKKNMRPFPKAKAAVKAIHNDFIKKRGLGLEVEGLLNAMVPDYLDQNMADEFFKNHLTEVDGVLTAAHIYIKNRDPKTGARFGEKRMAEVRKKVAEVRRRLEAGDDFGKVAREMSEDPMTAEKGGRLDNLLRIDPRMPASFCRATWKLQDRTWTGPIETRYGLHFVNRIKWIRIRTVVRLIAKNKDVRRMVRTYKKEDILFQARRDHSVTVLY